MTKREHPIGFESARMATWVGNRFKLVASVAAGKRPQNDSTPGKLSQLELYDIVNDANEKNDVAALHPGHVERMNQSLNTWRTSCRNSLNGRDYTPTK